VIIFYYFLINKRNKVKKFSTIILLLMISVITTDAIIYENAEDGSISRWNITDNNPSGAVVKNIFDIDKSSRIIETNGSSYDNQYMIGNLSEQSGAWGNTKDFYLLWSLKNSGGFLIDVILKTQNGTRYIRYSDNDTDLGMEDGFIINHGVGYSSANGVWHNFNRDLEADLQEFESNNSIISVDGLMIRGSCRVDNIELTDSSTDVDFVIYEDAEDNTTNGWIVSDNTSGDATITNIFDTDSQSRVIKFDSSAIYENEYKLGTWSNQKHFKLKWDMKTTEGFIVDILVSSTEGERYLRYTDEASTSKGKDGNALYHGLGYYASNGNWNTFDRDLQKDLKDIEPNNQILSVDSFLIRAKCRVDNIELYKAPSTIYEDAEDNTTQRWSIYSGSNGATITNIYDSTLNSRVISLQGDGMANQYIIGGDYINQNNSWEDKKYSNIEWNINNSGGFIISLVTNTINGLRYINYSDQNFTHKGIEGNTIFYGLGESASNGKWHTYMRDISSDIKEFEPSNKLLSVEGFIVIGSAMIDNLKLFNILHPTENSAGVTLTFDDTTVDSWFNMNDIFLKYGAKITFFVSHFFSLDTSEINKLKTLQTNGAEIATHTYNHKGVTRDFNNDIERIDEYINEQILPPLEDMRNRGFNPVSFAYPYGEHEEHYDSAVRGHTPYIRLTFDDSESRLSQQNAIYHKSSKRYRLLSAGGIDNDFNNSIDEIREALIKARKNGEIITLYGHNIVADSNATYAISPVKVEKIISISKDIGLKFYTFKEAYQIGDTY
jgi:peptidoglycan/xylan/chitin deacetylase (PgdA/CDA1 family)